MAAFSWDDYREGQLLAGMIAAMRHPDFVRLSKYRDQWHCQHSTADGGLRSVWVNSFIPDLPLDIGTITPEEFHRGRKRP